MLEIATTSSMTNSMKVPDCSSTPIGWMRMKVHAMPKNRSSMMKRMRQERRLAVLGVSSRNFRHSRMITRWMSSAPAVQTPDVKPQVHRLESSPTVTTRSRITGEADSRFCANWRSSS